MTPATSDGAITKLYWSEYHRKVTELAVDILGAEAMTPSGRHPSTAFQTDDPGAANSSASWVDTFLHARAGTIYAGSSQIQRNIIGEMVLGLPKEPKAPAGAASAIERYCDVVRGRSHRDVKEPKAG